MRCATRKCAHYSAVLLTLATIIVSGCFAQVVCASPLSELAASIQPGTFAQLEFPGVNLGELLSVCGSASTIGEYADSASWDPGSHQVLFLGNSHGNCYGSKFIIFSEDAHAWREGPLPADPCIAPMTQMCFAHAYSHNTIDPKTGIAYYRHYGQRTVWQFDTRGTQTWSVQSTIATRRDATGCCDGLEFLPSTTRPGLLFVDGSEGVYFGAEPAHDWQLLANTALAWDSTLPTLPMATHDNFAELDPVHGQILFGGGDVPVSLYTYDASGTITPRAAAPAGVMTNSTRAWVSNDPVSGRFLFFIDDGSFWEYDAIADVWARQSGTHPLAPRGAFTGFEVAITSYGVVMFMVWNFDATRVWLYKHRRSEPPPMRESGGLPMVDAGSSSAAAGTSYRDGGATTGASAHSDAERAGTVAGGCSCRLQAGPRRDAPGALALLFALICSARQCKRRVRAECR
jgi:hypothetical protein